MARSVRKSFNRKDEEVQQNAEAVDAELRKRAIETVTAKNDQAFRSLVDVQRREMKMLESERTWIENERARDVWAINNQEIKGIGQRFDRLQHELQRKHDSFWGKVHRVFGGHKHQQKQMKKLTAERNRIVTERTAQHVEQEATRQRSLTERHLRVEKDLQQAGERHAQDRDLFRQQREQSFDFAVQKEVQRLRVQLKPRM